MRKLRRSVKKVRQAKDTLVNATEEARKAKEVEARTKKGAEQTSRRLEAEEAKMTKKAAGEAKNGAEKAAKERSKHEAEDAKERSFKAAREALLADISSLDKVTEKATKEQAKREAEETKERFVKAAEEAKMAKKAAGEAKNGAEKAAKERAKREALEAKVRVKKEAEEAKEKAKRETEEAKRAQVAEQVHTELYSGMVTLLIARPVKYKRVGEFQEILAQVKDLRVMLVGGSAEEGSMIVVSVQQSVPLLSVLSELPIVEGVSKKDRGIEITLKADSDAVICHGA
jgi:hypothetical protein